MTALSGIINYQLSVINSKDKKCFKIINRKTIKLRPTGFSLIELLLAIAILALIGAVAIPNLNKFSKTQQLQATASDVANTLRTAQSSAQSRIKCPRGETSDTWMVRLSTNNYSLYAKCQTTDYEPIFTKLYIPSGQSGRSYIGSLNICNSPGQSTTDIIFSKNQVLYQCQDGSNAPPSTFATAIDLTLQDPLNSLNNIKVTITAGGVIRVQ